MSSAQMSRLRRGSGLVGICAGLLLLGPLLAAAAPPPDGPPEHGASRGTWGPRGPERWPREFESAWRLHPGFLRDLKLSEAQQDRIFAIEHAAAPALREQAKALRKAHEGLRNLGTSTNYDEVRVKTLTDASARAAAQLMLLRIRGEHEIYAVLAPEQQAEVSRRRERWEAGGHDRGPHGGGWHGDWQGERGGPSGAPPPPPSPPTG